MLQRLKFLYVRHFKLAALLNVSTSIFLTYLFVSKGFDRVNLYNIAFAAKFTAYGITLFAEKLLFAYRSYYYRNLGFSYRKLFGLFFGLDFLGFILMLICAWLWMNFT